MSAKDNTAFPDCLKIPLVVGVSGHIDILTPESEIEKRMDEFWHHLRKLAGPETPFILLSSLAAGADHLAVKYRPRDVKYIAVLPFDEAEYRKDFSPEALQDFENDLQNAYKVIRCDAVSGYYTTATDYIRQHSDVLLTLWDGYESFKPGTSTPRTGGTYYQIMTAFHLKTPHLQSKEKVHLVVNLSVKRAKENVARHMEQGEKDIGGFSEECSLSVLQDWDEKVSRFLKIDFDEYLGPRGQEEAGNAQDAEKETSDDIHDFKDVLIRIREHNEHLPTEQRKDYYLRNEFNEEIANGNSNTEKCFKLIEDDFTRLEYFDGLAEKHQRPFRKQFLRIAEWSILVGILGQLWGDITFAANDDLPAHEWRMHFFIIFYLVGFAILYLRYEKTQRNAHYFKYVKPRLIAEMLRLKIFWKLAGIGIKESFSDYFLKECSGYWFMLAVCNWELEEAPLSEEDLSWLNSGNGLDTVKRFWVQDQEKYYKSYLLDNPKRFIIPEKGEKCKEKIFPFKAWRRAYFSKYERCEGYSLCLKRFFIAAGFLLSFVLVVVFLIAQIRTLSHHDEIAATIKFPFIGTLPYSVKHKDILFLSHYREFIVGICPLIVATLGWMMEKHPWERLAPQYRKTLSLFRDVEKYLDEEPDPANKRQMIKELIKYAHDENREWNDIRIGAKPEPMI